MEIETSPGELLELVNYISDVPLRRLDDARAIEPLIALLHSSILFTDADTDERYRVEIAICLLTSDVDVIKPLMDYLGHDPLGDHLDQIFKAPTAIEHLRNISRSAIALLLAIHGDESLLPDLLALFYRINSRFVLKHIARTILLLNGEKGIDALTEELLNHPDPHVRRILVEVFAEWAYLDITQPLILMLKDESAFVAKTAIEALATIKSPRVLPFLLEATTDYRYVEVRVLDDAYVALAAIRAIGCYHTPETQQIVFDWSIGHLFSTDISIINRALDNLVELEDERAIPYLETALNSGHLSNKLHIYNYQKTVLLTLKKLGG